MIHTKVLEINAVHHCNNRCASCNHASPFAKAYYMDPLTLSSDLLMLSHYLHTGFFCIQGGEPLLHPRLLELMDIAFASEIADQYGILTNGRLFPRMPEEFWVKCRDQKIELRCSVYGNLEPEALEVGHAKAAQYNLNFRPGPIGSFHKMLGHYPNGESFFGCPWVTCHTVHEGYFYICPISTFWPEQFMGLPKTIDGFQLNKITEEGIFNFIHRKTPLESCKRWTGAKSPQIPWHESKSLEEWMKESSV